MRLRTLVPVTLVLAATLSAPAGASDWPHVRGPETDGRVAAPGLFDGDAVGLLPGFRVPLGSGYSGIAVAGGRAVTMLADGDGDFVAAFDAASGRERWRFRLGDRTVGHDGSHDGPLSSPVIGGDAAFGLGSDGRLVALSLADGQLLWEKKIDRDLGSERPHFGFTTTPTYSDGVLVVQTGGAEGKAVAGFNGKSGDLIWSLGDDEIEYQSPAVMTLAGRRQVVAVSGSRIVGLAPESGELLWAHPLEEGARTGSSTPSFIDNDRFAVSVTGQARVYRVSKSAEGFGVEELYRSDALGGNYAPPVYHDGHLYGFRGQILTCVNADTGERVWRSREPGGDGLILVDGNLVIFGAKGNVVVAAASPEGYVERARLQALEGSSLTWPSFADGRIYLRNLEEMAAVQVKAGAAPAVARAGDDAGAGTAFAAWLQKVAAADDKQAVVDAYFAGVKQTPLVEGDHVHFVYRDAAAGDVGLAGSMNVTDALEPMQKVAGTDLFYRTLELPAASHWEYRFQVNFEDWTTDPLNPRSVPATEGDDMLSALIPADFPSASFTEEPAEPRGAVEAFSLKSAALGWDKEIQVWLPPDYADSKASYPLLLVNDTESWIDKGLLVNALDNLVGKSVQPVVVAFVKAHRAWWLEAGGSRTADYVAMLAGELMPELKKRYRLSDTPGGHAILGHRFYAFSSAYAALEHPELFGKVGMQSAYIGLGEAEELMALIATGDAQKVSFYLDWNRFDERNIDRDWDFARDSRTLDQALRARGFAVAGGEVVDSHGWAGWRTRIDDILTTLYPLAGVTAGGGR